MSVIHRFQGGADSWKWEDVPVEAIKAGVTGQRFISKRDGSCNLELRYFEIQPGAASNCEKHNYEHAVLVLRGRGTVVIREDVFPVQFGDAIFVDANAKHQFRANKDEPFGFLCTVLAETLRPQVLGEQKRVLFDDERCAERRQA